MSDKCKRCAVLEGLLKDVLELSAEGKCILPRTALFSAIERHIGADHQMISRYYDSETGLEWMPGPDEDTDYYRAEEWLESLPDEGWRMPTVAELETLYRRGCGTRNMARELTCGWFVWAADECESSSGAFAFNFFSGFGRWYGCVRSLYSRVFAVRPGRWRHQGRTRRG